MTRGFSSYKTLMMTLYPREEVVVGKNQGHPKQQLERSEGTGTGTGARSWVAVPWRPFKGQTPHIYSSLKQLTVNK